MPSILTIKQQEAQEACDHMNTTFVNLNTQVNVTHTGFTNLNTQTNNRETPINDSQSEFSDIDTKSNAVNTKTQDMLQEAINMNNLQ